MKNELPLAVFESLGVWGKDEDLLTVSIDENISDLEIFIDSTAPDILNLRSVDVLSKGDCDVLTDEYVSSIVISSDFFAQHSEEVDIKRSIFEKKPVRSKLELRPAIKVKFISDLDVGSIKLGNRFGHLGDSSRFIAVNAIHNGSIVKQFHNVPYSLIDSLRKELESVLSRYGKNVSFPKNGKFVGGYIRSILNEVIESGGEITPILRAAVLPHNGRVPRLDTYSANYITEFIQENMGKKGYFGTKILKRFSAILCNDVAIDTLGEFASQKITEEKEVNTKVVISKHRIHCNTLMSKHDNHLDFLDNLLASLNAESTSGSVPLVSYGTLLGAYRNGAFLPADDDLDIILYFPDTYSQEDRDFKIADVIGKLQMAGYKVIARSGRPHITVNSSDSVGVDIFPAWGSGGRVDVVMEGLLYRKIDLKLLLPAGKIDLYGRSYPCPGNVEGFLENRYGEGWDRTNPYYAWAWSISKQRYFDDSKIAAKYTDRERKRQIRAQSARTKMVAWSQCVLETPRPPSNSIPMALQAIEYGYDVIELDIRVTLDGEVVLAHDDLLKNESGESIRLSKSTLAQVQKFKLGDFKGEDVFVPSLSDVLPLLSGKQVLLDARFGPKDYEKLKKCISDIDHDPSLLLFCVYEANQLPALIEHFSESLLFWKFYTQAWEIDNLVLDQVRAYGVDGIMFMYPHYDEDVSEKLYEIKRRDLQSMCFIHGRDWIPPSSSGLDNDQNVRVPDIYDASLRKMVASGIEYVTTTECLSNSFLEIKL